MYKLAKGYLGDVYTLVGRIFGQLTCRKPLYSLYKKIKHFLQLLQELSNQVIFPEKPD